MNGHDPEYKFRADGEGFIRARAGLQGLLMIWKSTTKELTERETDTGGTLVISLPPGLDLGGAAQETDNKIKNVAEETNDGWSAGHYKLAGQMVAGGSAGMDHTWWRALPVEATWPWRIGGKRRSRRCFLLGLMMRGALFFPPRAATC